MMIWCKLVVEAGAFYLIKVEVVVYFVDIWEKKCLASIPTSPMCTKKNTSFSSWYDLVLML
jgi:hypothetical protein